MDDAEDGDTDSPCSLFLFGTAMEELSIAGLPRTTNPAEGWYNRLNFIMDKAHPSFTEFLQKLQNEVAAVTRQILRLDTGGSLR